MYLGSLLNNIAFLIIMYVRIEDLVEAHFIKHLFSWNLI